MSTILFENGTLLDTESGQLRSDHAVLVEDGWIKEVSDRPIRAASAQAIDLRGRTIMPGLCDAHVHVTQLASNTSFLRDAAPSYVSAQASVVLREMLARGYTTVRDAGGADYGLADAVDHGLFAGPRLLFAGHALSQTGGHGDQRTKGEDSLFFCPNCVGRSGRVCDGADEVRRAARDELRKGAHQIKIMVSGGITSPLDQVEHSQFTEDEIRAAVAEAKARGRYVMAHAYTAEAIARSVRCGVRCIEHGNMIDETTADLMVAHDAFLVPTLVVSWAMAKYGESIGVPAMFQVKVQSVWDAALRGLEIAHRKGIRMAFGTDLFGKLHEFQSHEFSLRAEVQPPIDVIRAATIGCAELFNMVGEIGVLKPGARADLLVIDGNPVANLDLLQQGGRFMDIIMKDGTLIKHNLAIS
jgi:imidazolonepropionase-like amidohydrolase